MNFISAFNNSYNTKIQGVNRKIKKIVKMQEIMQFPSLFYREITEIEKEFELREKFEKRLQSAWKTLQEEIINPEMERRTRETAFKGGNERILGLIVKNEVSRGEIEDLTEFKKLFEEKAKPDKMEEFIANIHSSLNNMLKDTYKCDIFPNESEFDFDRVGKEIEQMIGMFNETNLNMDYSIMTESQSITLEKQKSNNLLDGTIYASQHLGERNQLEDELKYIYPKLVDYAAKVSSLLGIESAVNQEKPESLGYFIERISKFAVKANKIFKKMKINSIKL